MDANGTHFHLLLGKHDWARCTDAQERRWLALGCIALRARLRHSCIGTRSAPSSPCSRACFSSRRRPRTIRRRWRTAAALRATVSATGTGSMRPRAPCVSTRRAQA